MNAHIKPPTTAPNKEIEWVLARARCMSAGLRLVQFEIDEIGISLKNGCSRQSTRRVASPRWNSCPAMRPRSSTAAEMPDD